MQQIIQLDERSPLSNRDQICEAVGSAIAMGTFGEGQKLPSCRTLAKQLKVSRSTVFSAYCNLVELGVLDARDRSGFVVAIGASAYPRDPNTQEGTAHTAPITPPAFTPNTLAPDRSLQHPVDWNDYPYPFIFNQVDPHLFPLEAWRECSRLALSRRTMPEWMADVTEVDSPQLVKQLRQRLLAHRGILADDEEILITMGAQNALSILGLLFAKDRRKIAIEDPGFHEARNAFHITGNDLTAAPVDEDGLIPDAIPKGCKLVFCTPNHHFPTMVTLQLERRHAVLDRAVQDGFYVIEDDYEMELAGGNGVLPPLHSLDRHGSVIHVGSLSKSITPSLRLGFIVAHREIIRQARDVRRLLVRQPPGMIQDTAALFLALGHHDAHIKRLKRRYTRRWQVMQASIDKHLPNFQRPKATGGTSVWLTGKDGFDASAFCDDLKRHGILADKGRTFFLNGDRNNNLRLGFSCIPVNRIDAGIQAVREVYRSFKA
ncbi:PLP-dependent aminotransferase family protein [Hwanghaeella grinnelliae]|uniref:PLP-dependent aminotransferase family protein n=2 Tax=Hwanghaeella grinnelliae TaxID=2500179 RepID=A0A437QZ92_9PROT|nr:PLP-dependent aminotransferase family protein [Hwanghaeella grinnelliae]